MIRLLWLTLGIAALIIGTIGILLPLLPTTPFILAATACFAKSSQRFHSYLLNHKYFGPIIKDWQETRTIPPKAKIFMAVTIIISLSYLISKYLKMLS